MKLKNGKISILINQEYTTIELFDGDSRLVFARVTLTPDQLSGALSRLANTDCEIETTDVWDRLGKKMEHDKFEFEIESRRLSEKEVYAVAVYELKKAGKDKEGWVADSYFGSKDSFYSMDTEGGEKHFARAVIRRWI